MSEPLSQHKGPGAALSRQAREVEDHTTYETGRDTEYVWAGVVVVAAGLEVSME